MGRANIIMAAGFIHGSLLSVIHSFSILCKCILFHVSVISHISDLISSYTLSWKYIYKKKTEKKQKDSSNVLMWMELAVKTCQCYSSDIK